MTLCDRGSDLWLRRYHPAPEAGLELVCFPHAGGSATFYQPVARALSPEIDVSVVQYPGRQDRHDEPGVDDIRTLADRIVAVLRPPADRPVAFFGHSMGAVLAFEVARRWQGRGHGLGALFASGRRAPSTSRPEERVHLLDDAGLIAEIRALNGTDARIFDEAELLRMILPALRSDYRAIETYRYADGPPLDCPIVALVGADDPHTTLAEARAWARHTSSDFDLRVFPGGHFYLVEQAPAVTEVLLSCDQRGFTRYRGK